MCLQRREEEKWGCSFGLHLCDSHMPHTMLCSLWSLSHIILTLSLSGRTIVELWYLWCLEEIYKVLKLGVCVCVHVCMWFSKTPNHSLFSFGRSSCGVGGGCCGHIAQIKDSGRMVETTEGEAHSPRSADLGAMENQSGQSSDFVCRFGEVYRKSFGSISVFHWIYPSKY